VRIVPAPHFVFTAPSNVHSAKAEALDDDDDDAAARSIAVATMGHRILVVVVVGRRRGSSSWVVVVVAVVVFVVAVDKTNGWMATARALAHATAADARTGNNGVEPGTTPSPAWSRYASTAGEDGGWQTCSWLSSTVLPGLCGSA